MSELTICPCCGAEVEGDLLAGCVECGARAVGPPLPRPERELPGYGHALAISAAGLLLALAFAAAFVSALWQRETFDLRPSALLRAAESAAWGLKWSALPASFALAFACARLYASMCRARARFVGHCFARAGLAATLAVMLALSAFVGVTVPERLRMRELARRAGENALLYSTDLALARYRRRFGTYPATLEDLRRLEDPDGSVAKLLAAVGAGDYRPRTDLASLSTGRAKARVRRRVRADDDMQGDPIVLTNYELVLPGGDGVNGTDDDLRLSDGLILDAPRAANTKGAATQTVGGRRAH
ncbi:MAG: hypothetical protein DMF67_12320 [Acidobacteria bacterium]|nr:MAG: hypothetical protein DMF67_12320 [Acidobacteriota bacterium]